MHLSRAHPTPEQLAAFGLGRLSQAEARDVENHVAECAECVRLLESLPGDTLVGLLQEASTVLPSGASDVALSARKDAESVPAELVDHPRYRVLELVGVGGMGAVYKAEHRLMQRVVALKVIHPKLLTRSDAADRFHREVRAAARLSHPNVVAAYDAEQAGATHFLVTEFIEGQTLAEIVARSGPLAVEHAASLIHQAALGLEHAHERGMVHRDIKPQNLIVTSGGQLKILDFGLSLFVSESGDSTALTEAGAVMGTVDYLAPEQARNAHAADIRADIYSLGCTLYFLLAGHPPHPDGSLVEKITAHLEREPRPLHEIRRDLPRELVEVARRMMALDPAARFATPGDVAAALEPFIAEGHRRRGEQRPGTIAAAARASSSQAPLTGSHVRRWSIAGVAVASVALIAVAMLVWKATRDRRGLDQTETQNTQITAAVSGSPTSDTAGNNSPRVVALWNKDEQVHSFVARADLDAAAVQAQMEECLQDGLRPICINGYVAEGGETLYAGLWIDDDPPIPHVARYELDARALRQQIDTLPDGHNPIWLDVYGAGAARRYAAIWINDGRAMKWNSASYLGTDAVEQTIAEAAKKGLRPAMLSGHTGPTGLPQYTLVLVEESAKSQAFPSLSFEELRQTIDRLPNGWRPSWIDVYPGSEARRYALICIEDASSPEWRFSFAPTIGEYQSQFEEQIRDGYRPVIISVD